jgi:hypothetical protein
MRRVPSNPRSKLTNAPVVSTGVTAASDAEKRKVMLKYGRL